MRDSSDLQNADAGSPGSRLSKHDDAVETDLRRLQSQLESFNRARDWDQFHSPRNLAMALSVEAGERVFGKRLAVDRCPIDCRN